MNTSYKWCWIQGDIVGRYSSEKKLLRVTAWIIRFAWNCSTRNKVKGSLNSEEIRKAKYCWIREAQTELTEETTKLRTVEIKAWSQRSQWHLEMLWKIGTVRAGTGNQTACTFA